MTVNFDAIEDLIEASSYGTIKGFFEKSSVEMTAQNYYKLKRTSGKIKGNHLQTICEELGCRLSDITDNMANEPVGSYTKSLKTENELLRILLTEKDEVITLLKDKLNKYKTNK